MRPTGNGWNVSCAVRDFAQHLGLFFFGILVYYLFRWKPQCRVLYERVVLQARPNQPQRKLISLKTIHTRVGWVWLTKSYQTNLHWGWLGLECETTQEATMSTKILEAGTGKQLLRMPTWEWQPCRSVCCGGFQKATLGYSALNERYWPHFLVVVLYTCLFIS